MRGKGGSAPLFTPLGLILRVTVHDPRFPDPDTIVFVVERATSFLLGASIPVPVVAFDAQGKANFVNVTQSASPIIRASASLLQSIGWPQTLLVYQGNYVKVQ